MKKIILFSVGFVIVAGSIFFAVNSKKGYYTDENFMSKKQFTSSKGLEMLYKMKANQNTGLINMADVVAAKNQLSSMRLHKAGFPLIWEESGPDNVGGRCRTILIDRKNPNTLYAAGVSGGIFKSTNGAGSWSALDDALPTLAFQSSCQTINGTIYFGSGENAGSFGGGGDNEGSSFPGEGIFKSTDGKTFTQLSTTLSFNQVNSMASAPDKNVAYAGTNTNLKYSDDEGATWKNVFTGSCRDVKVASNGTVLAYMGNKIYRSTTPTVSGSYVAATGITITGGFNRLVIGISPQDPNYVYVLGSTAGFPSNNFGGLFQSTDGGATFNLIVPAGSKIFNPLNQGAGGQGDYDLCVAVHPRDKKRVFMGAVVMAEWTESLGATRVYNGTHADQHWITFDTVSSPMRMYVGCDGGVYRSINDKFTMLSEYNIGFNVTQFYGIAASADGDIIGGTQDNGTLYINKIGTEKKRAYPIYGGDGFRCEISTKNRSSFIVEGYFGNIGRSQNKGSAFGHILDNRIVRYKFEDGTLQLDPKGTYINAPFNTAIKLSENDTLSRLYVGANDGVWLVQHLFDNSASPSWFKISSLVAAFVIETSYDGRYVFAARSGQVIRIKVPMQNLDTMKNLDSRFVYPGITSDNITGNLPGRFITGIGVDRGDSNRLIVTMGNYGNTNYIYYTENALAPVPTWKAIQGNLPSMPVYDAEFVYDNPNMVVIGTEFGVFGTTNVKAASVVWVEQNQGLSAAKPFPRVATYELRQVENKIEDIGSVIFAGTHGRGIFETKSLFTGIKNPDGTISARLSIYPNPATDFATLQYSVTQKDNISIIVMDMTGKIVYEKLMKNETPGLKKQRIETNTLAKGTYIVQVSGAKHKGAAKMIIQN